MIDESTASAGVMGLNAIEGSLAWGALDKIIRAAEPADVADNAMQKLRDRIAKKREMLADTP